MIVTVTVEVPFIMGGQRLYIGDKIKVTKEKAKELAHSGLIKSVLMPVFDKMMKTNKTRRKEI